MAAADGHHQHGCILVIGGGFAGLSACTGIRQYNSKVHIVLVEPKDHMEIFWMSYRSIFVPEVADASMFSLTKFAKKHSVQHIRSAVTELTMHQAILASGDVIEFDICVVSTGASNPYPGLGRSFEGMSSTRDERLQSLKEHGQSLLDASTVLIVGGGLVGCELGADLAVYSASVAKSTRVIIVHSEDHVCPEMTESAARMVQEKLEELGVRVILNNKAIQNTEGKWILESNGEMIMKPDIVVMANGINPMNSFVDPGWLDDQGWMNVDEYFQVKGAEGTIFALGDCCTLLPNTASQILSNIGAIGYNVTAALDAKKEGTGRIPRLSKAYHALEWSICTVGPEDGVAFTPFCAFDWILPGLKNSSMFICEPRIKLGLEQEDKG